MRQYHCGEYGAKVAYRQSVLRDWLVMEIRPSVTWPKEHPIRAAQSKLGRRDRFRNVFRLEDEFQARPATF